MHINQVLENRDVVIQNGKITDIRKHLENDTISYELGRVDGTGKYLLPSFADAHAHLPEEGNLDTYFLMNLLNGVTTLRSMRGENWHLDIAKSEFTPKLILSAPPITRRYNITKNEAENLFETYKTQGFDFIKILSVKDATTFDILVAQSKEKSLPLAGHCPSNVGILNTCESGVFQSIEHLGGVFQLSQLDDINKAIDLSIAKNVYHCPTLDWYFTGQVIEDALRNRKGAEFLPDELISEWEKKINSYYSETTEEKRSEDRNKSKQSFETRLNYLRYIYRQGGKLLLSPDASGIYGIPGFGIHTEMQHFSNADISNYDILKSTCYNLSEMLNSENEWGTIKIGTKSDMILLNANPIENIEHAKEINGIVLNGKFYPKEKLESELNKKR
jgi:imidazolonepropionase-like amidohydrolase